MPYNTPTTRQIGVPYGFHPTPVDLGNAPDCSKPTFTIWDPKIACLNRSKLL